MTSTWPLSTGRAISDLGMDTEHRTGYMSFRASEPRTPNSPKRLQKAFMPSADAQIQAPVALTPCDCQSSKGVPSARVQRPKFP